MAEKQKSPCGTCGMLVWPREYHPQAACLMYAGCKDADVVRANLLAVIEYAEKRVAKMHAPRLPGKE